MSKHDKPDMPESKHSRPRSDIPSAAGAGLVHVSAFILLAITGIALPAVAQDDRPPMKPSVEATQPAARSSAQSSPQPNAQAPRNAFGENIVPKARPAGARAQRPYVPIKKPDDETEIPEIEMFVGESRVFPAPGVARIAVGNGQIMTAAALDGKEVILFANGVGTSSLFVWNEDGRYQRVKVNIVPGDTTRVAREVASFLTTIPHAKASIVGDKVIVEGDALTDADLAKIELLEKRYPQIVNFTNRLGWEPMVMLDVKVVEFPVSELRELGLKWNTTGGAAVAGVWSPSRRGHDGPYQLNIQTGQGSQPPVTSADGGTDGVKLTSSLNVLTGLNMGLNAQLNLLAQDGKATVLSEPQLAARSGARASFLAGGEFPYSVATRDGITVQFKKYGVKLDIEPKVDRTGAVRATVDAEVSKIDPSVSTPNGPALLTRTTRTEFNLRSGETMVMSGLIERDHSTNVDKIPLLGDIPVLGALFRSRRFQNRETELVVFVTPRIVDPGSPGQADRIEKVHERLGQRLGPKPYLSDPLLPGVDPAGPFPASSQQAPVPAAPEQDSASAGIKGPLPVEPVTPVPVASPSAAAPAQTANPSAASALPAVSQARRGPGGTPLRVKHDKAVVRASPNHRADVLLQLERGAVVRLGDKGVAGAGGSWRHVAVGELQGWLPADAVTPLQGEPGQSSHGPASIAGTEQQGRNLQLGASAGVLPVPGRRVTADLPSGPAAGQGQTGYRVILNRLALRVAPDINADVVTHLSAGQSVRALDQPPRRQWMAVEADGMRGWVSGQWLKPDDQQPTGDAKK